MSYKTDTDENRWHMLSQRLAILSRLLALEVVKNIKSQRDRVEALGAAGLSAEEIGELLGIKPATVRVTLFQIRQSRAKDKAKQARKTRRS